MTRAIHKVTLLTQGTGGERLPAQATGQFLAALTPAIRYTVSLALRGRSWFPEKTPDCLERAADLRLVGVEDNGGHTLSFEAPPLGEAARELYAQLQDTCPLPSAEDTGFDLLGDVLEDVMAGNAGSGRFDGPPIPWPP